MTLNKIRDDSSKNNAIIIIAFLGILARLCFINFWLHRTTPDTFYYIFQAKMILLGTPVSGFPNGYPLVISILILLFGKTSIIPILLFFNVFCQIATGYYVYKINLVLNNSSFVKFVSLALFAFYLPQILFTNMLLTESISILIMTATIYYSLKGDWIFAGILGFVLSSFRIVLFPFIPILILFSILKKNRTDVFNMIIGFVTAAIIFFSLDAFGITKFPNNYNYNLLVAINGNSSPIKFDISTLTSSQLENPLWAYLEFMYNKPGTFIFQRLDSLYELWGPYPFGINNSIIRFIFGFRFILLIAWFYALHKVIRRKTSKKVSEFIILCSIPIILITAFHFIFFSSFRFIVPLEPFMIINFSMMIEYYIKQKRISFIEKWF